MNSPGPPQSRFDILSWLRTTWTLRTPRVTEGHFVFFVPNPYNMGVYGLPWTPTSKIWHFELTQDHLDTEDTEGNRRSLCPFWSQLLQYGCLWTPLDPAVSICYFGLTQYHLGTEDSEGVQRSLRLFCSKPLHYGCLWTPLDPHIQDLTFRADSGPPGHWGHRG